MRHLGSVNGLQGLHDGVPRGSSHLAG
jgi:hypothetical protein